MTISLTPVLMNIDTNSYGFNLTAQGNPNAKIELVESGTVIGDKTADSSGKAVFNFSSPFYVGSHTYQVRQNCVFGFCDWSNFATVNISQAAAPSPTPVIPTPTPTPVIPTPTPTPVIPTPVGPGQCPAGYRKMSDETKRFITFDCPSSVKESILAQVAEAETKCQAKYRIIFPGGCYFVENGIQYGAVGNCAESGVNVGNLCDAQTPVTPTPTPTPVIPTPIPTPVTPTPTPTPIVPTPTPTPVTPTPTPTPVTPTPTTILGLSQVQLLALAGGALVIITLIAILMMRRRR